MENTNNLKLPLLVPNQSGKEITHNEALIILDNLIHNGVIDKDLTVPPENPNANDLYIVAPGATGAWSGKDRQLAYYDNGWRFNEAKKGAFYWVNDESCIYVFNSVSWSKYSGGEGGSSGGGVSNFSELEDVLLTSLSSGDIIKFDGSSFVNSKTLQGLTRLGVNCDADANNKLSVKSDYVLFDNTGTNSRVKVNKNSATDTASHLFQTNYAGKAEFGLIGNDDFTLKVSSDGESWNNAFVVDKATGNVDFKANITKNGVEIGSGGSSQNVWISEEYTSAKNMSLEITHNLNLVNVLRARCDVVMKCNVAEGGYAVGDFAINPVTNTYESSYNLSMALVPCLTSNKIYFVTGNDGLFMVNKNTGYRFRPTYNNWSLIFRIFY